MLVVGARLEIIDNKLHVTRPDGASATYVATRDLEDLSDLTALSGRWILETDVGSSILDIEPTGDAVLVGSCSSILQQSATGAFLASDLPDDFSCFPTTNDVGQQLWSALHTEFRIALADDRNVMYVIPVPASGNGGFLRLTRAG